MHQGQRQQPDRDIYQKHPMPTVIVRQPASQRRADRWTRDHHDAVTGEGQGAPLGREGVDDHRLFDGRQAASAYALENAGEDEKG
jgi:hypothetical protein